MQQGEEKSAEIKELRQRLWKKLEQTSQETEQWKKETKEFSTALSRVKEEYEIIIKSLKDELVEKGSL